ncbi:TPA: FAD-dependent oxidoreductase [Candidatus Sumerlaeota bacterium]|jgi:NADH:ubiquinone reductase (H+-translocating)|nr:FAD-dependent oxidoreductase [Candidatus Sumerlaeota bacterium]
MLLSVPPRIVVIGGGFAGLYFARHLRKENVHVTLVDKRNFHLFQPLLYQVATGGLNAGDISAPLRSIFRNHERTVVLLAEMVDLDSVAKKVILSDGELEYDYLVIATGAKHHYFGHPEWEKDAPGLKTLEDAMQMRRRIFLAFEAAERQTDPKLREEYMTFVIVGGGPTGVELAGALGELALYTLRHDFSFIKPNEVKIHLLEGMDRVLQPFPPSLSERARKGLESLGVTVETNCCVTNIDIPSVRLKRNGQEDEIRTRTVLWGAGVQASPLGKVLADRAGAELDRCGRVMVQPNLTLPGHPEIFVLGDIAHVKDKNGNPLPQVAPAAIQEGDHAAHRLIAQLHGNKDPGDFCYFDKGSLAVIGRNAAVCFVGKLRMHGFIAWLMWAFVHIHFLIQFQNKLVIMVQWAWSYVTRQRGPRIITGKSPFPLVKNEKDRK